MLLRRFRPNMSVVAAPELATSPISALPVPPVTPTEPSPATASVWPVKAPKTSPAQLTIDGIPNVSPEWFALRDLDVVRFNIKQNGYALGRALLESLPPIEGTSACSDDLGCKASTQRDSESDWAAHWFAELKVARVYHRKLWEFAYVLQSLHTAGLLRDGVRGLGFGCGKEPLPSYFAARGMSTMVTDLDPSMNEAQAWRGTNQHTDSLADSHHPALVTRDVFMRRTRIRHADMNAIPDDLAGYDFCWSICALEHLGSIKQGLDFIEESLKTVRPGGLAIHTTEFNYANDVQTIDNWSTVLFQRRHFEEIAKRLTAKGHKVGPLDFEVGREPMDRFIDVPPYYDEVTKNGNNYWINHPNGPQNISQLKLAIDGFPTTCFGLTIERGY